MFYQSVVWELENPTFPFFFFSFSFSFWLITERAWRDRLRLESARACLPCFCFSLFFFLFFYTEQHVSNNFFFSLLPCPDCWGEVNWGATDSSGSCDFFFLFKKKKFFYSINIWHSKKKRKEIPIRWWTRFIIRTCLVFTCRTAAGRLEAEGGQSSCTLLTYDKLKVSWSKGGGGARPETVIIDSPVRSFLPSDIVSLVSFVSTFCLVLFCFQWEKEGHLITIMQSYYNC